LEGTLKIIWFQPPCREQGSKNVIDIGFVATPDYGGVEDVGPPSV